MSYTTRTLDRTNFSYKLSQGGPYKQCVCLCSKYKEIYGRLLKSLKIVNLYRGMPKLKLKINVNVPQLLFMVVSVALNGEFERFGGFCVDCYYRLFLDISLRYLDSSNILPYISLYFEHKQTHCLYRAPCVDYYRFLEDIHYICC